jgi:TRAP-type transport system periplasmic protein
MGHRREFLRVMLGIMAVSVGLGLRGTEARAGDPVRIKLATLAPRGSSLHNALMEMRDEWRRAPDGGAELTIYTDGSMGGEMDVVRKMRSGQLQAATMSAQGLSAIDPSANALQVMPMVFRSWEEMDYVREKVRGRLEEQLLAKGYVTIFWGDAGWVRYFARAQFVTPADLQKMKIFVWAGSNEQVDLMKAMGFHPVPLETADILPGLKTGLIDVIPTTPIYANASQFHLTAPYMLELNWAPIVGATVIAAKTWNALSPAAQASLREAGEEAGAKIRAKSRQESEQAVEAMKRRGLTVQPVTPEIEAQWREMAEAVYPRLRGSIVPADIFDHVHGLLREYRSRGAEGRQ